MYLLFLHRSNKPNPAAISSVKPGMMNGANGASESPPVSGKACESCYSMFMACYSLILMKDPR